MHFKAMHVTSYTPVVVRLGPTPPFQPHMITALYDKGRMSTDAS